MTSSERWKTLACFLLIHAVALSGSATEIRLKQRVESRGSVVLLGDIADLSEATKPTRADGNQAADIASLARIELFPAPSVSRSRTVRQREVRELLGLHGIDLKTVRFAGADSVVIKTVKRSTPRNVTPGTNTIAARRQSFADAKPIALANQAIEAPATELILAVVNDARRGEIIRALNVALIPVPVAGAGSPTSRGIQPVVHREDVIGMAAKRPLRANQPLDLRTLERPLVVKRGELVTVTSKAPGVSVQTVALRNENASMGDLLVLESIVNRKKYTARVTGSKTAEVYAGGIQVSSPTKRPATRNEPSSPKRRAAQ